MIIRTRDNGFNHPLPSEITPQAVYRSRRQWLLAAAALGGGGIASWAGRSAWAQAAAVPRPGKLAALPGRRSVVPGAATMEALTSYGDATSYNNYYEFGTGKDDPARYADQLSIDPWTIKIDGMVEKPAAEDAPSRQAVVGRYILDAAIFDALETQKPGAGGEIQLTDAIARGAFDLGLGGFQFSGARFDCGSKAGMLEATLELATRDPECLAVLKARGLVEPASAVAA